MAESRKDALDLVSSHMHSYVPWLATRGHSQMVAVFKLVSAIVCGIC